jgi:hypothetical protein
MFLLRATGRFALAAHASLLSLCSHFLDGRRAPGRFRSRGHARRAMARCATTAGNAFVACRGACCGCWLVRFLSIVLVRPGPVRSLLSLGCANTLGWLTFRDPTKRPDLS